MLLEPAQETQAAAAVQKAVRAQCSGSLARAGVPRHARRQPLRVYNTRRLPVVLAKKALLSIRRSCASETETQLRQSSTNLHVARSPPADAKGAGSGRLRPVKRKQRPEVAATRTAQDQAGPPPGSRSLPIQLSLRGFKMSCTTYVPDV